jgi:heme exporter protein D
MYRSGSLFIYEGYIATSYITIVGVILKLVERHKQTTIDIKRQHWRKKRRRGGVENTIPLRPIRTENEVIVFIILS